MHITIAWWDRSDVAYQRTGEGAGVCVSNYPGLLVGNPISDDERDRDGWALVWETAADADVMMGTLAVSAYGCAPSHSWGFDLNLTSAAHMPTLPEQLLLLTS